MICPFSVLVFLPQNPAKNPAKNPKRCIGCDLEEQSDLEKQSDLEEQSDLDFSSKYEGACTLEDHQLKRKTLLETTSIQDSVYSVAIPNVGKKFQERSCKKKMPTSCNNCRQAKVKCNKQDDEKACSRCKRLGKKCVQTFFKREQKEGTSKDHQGCRRNKRCVRKNKHPGHCKLAENLSRKSLSRKRKRKH